MIDYINVFLVIVGFIQGVASAGMYTKEESMTKADLREMKESFREMGATSFISQKKVLLSTSRFSAMIRFLFSVPTFLYFVYLDIHLGIMLAFGLLILDVIKTKRSFRLIMKTSSLEQLLKSRSNAFIHFSRLIIKAFMIALLLSKGV